MKTSSAFMKVTAAALSLTLFTTNVLLAHSPKANFWADRKKSRDEDGTKQPTMLASLPMPLPPIITPSAFVSRQIAKDIPRDLKSHYFPIVQALTSSHGTVRGVSIPAGKQPARTVIHIQDVHLNPEAQENISKTIHGLIQEKKVDLVALEGAFAPMDFSWFHAYPYQDSVKAVADYLFDQKKISGAVYATVTHGKPAAAPIYVGVDHRDHYRANVEAYKRSAPLVNTEKKRLAKMERDLAERKASAFNKDLATFDARIQAYRKGNLAWGDYVRLLAGRSADIPHDVEIFLSALDLESSLDFKRVEAERTALLSQLVSKLSKVQSADLVNHSAAYRLGRLGHDDFYDYLRDLCRAHGVDLGRFKAMDGYIRYVLLSDSINIENVLSDAARLEEAAYAALAKTPEERELIHADKRLHLTGKLLDFALTKEEWAEYMETNKQALFPSPAGRGQGGVLLRQGARPPPPPPGGGAEGEGSKRASPPPPGGWGGGGGSPQATPLLTSPRRGEELGSFEAFYREAEARDFAMADNVLRSINATQADVTVLVTGGFHSSGIDALLKERGLATIAFVPKITKVDDASGSHYLSVFTQEKTPLDKLFAGEKLFLAGSPAPAMAPTQTTTKLHTQAMSSSDGTASIENERFEEGVNVDKTNGKIRKVWVEPKKLPMILLALLSLTALTAARPLATAPEWVLWFVGAFVAVALTGLFIFFLSSGKQGWSPTLYRRLNLEELEERAVPSASITDQDSFSSQAIVQNNQVTVGAKSEQVLQDGDETFIFSEVAGKPQLSQLWWGGYFVPSQLALQAREGDTSVYLVTRRVELPRSGAAFEERRDTVLVVESGFATVDVMPGATNVHVLQDDGETFVFSMVAGKPQLSQVWWGASLVPATLTLQAQEGDRSVYLVTRRASLPRSGAAFEERQDTVLVVENGFATVDVMAGAASVPLVERSIKTLEAERGRAGNFVPLSEPRSEPIAPFIPPQTKDESSLRPADDIAFIPGLFVEVRPQHGIMGSQSGVPDRTNVPFTARTLPAASKGSSERFVTAGVRMGAIEPFLREFVDLIHKAQPLTLLRRLGGNRLEITMGTKPEVVETRLNEKTGELIITRPEKPEAGQVVFKIETAENGEPRVVEIDGKDVRQSKEDEIRQIISQAMKLLLLGVGAGLVGTRLAPSKRRETGAFKFALTLAVSLTVLSSLFAGADSDSARRAVLVVEWVATVTMVMLTALGTGWLFTLLNRYRPQFAFVWAPAGDAVNTAVRMDIPGSAGGAAIPPVMAVRISHMLEDDFAKHEADLEREWKAAQAQGQPYVLIVDWGGPLAALEAIGPGFHVAVQEVGPGDIRFIMKERFPEKQPALRNLFLSQKQAYQKSLEDALKGKTAIDSIPSANHRAALRWAQKHPGTEVVAEDISYSAWLKAALWYKLQQQNSNPVDVGIDRFMQAKDIGYAALHESTVERNENVPEQAAALAKAGHRVSLLIGGGHLKLEEKIVSLGVPAIVAETSYRGNRPTTVLDEWALGKKPLRDERKRIYLRQFAESILLHVAIRSGQKDSQKIFETGVRVSEGWSDDRILQLASLVRDPEALARFVQANLPTDEDRAFFFGEERSHNSPLEVQGAETGDQKEMAIGELVINLKKYGGIVSSIDVGFPLMKDSDEKGGSKIPILCNYKDYEITEIKQRLKAAVSAVKEELNNRSGDSVIQLIPEREFHVSMRIVKNHKDGVYMSRVDGQLIIDEKAFIDLDAHELARSILHELYPAEFDALKSDKTFFDRWTGTNGSAKKMSANGNPRNRPYYAYLTGKHADLNLAAAGLMVEKFAQKISDRFNKGLGDAARELIATLKEVLSALLDKADSLTEERLNSLDGINNEPGMSALGPLLAEEIRNATLPISLAGVNLSILNRLGALKNGKGHNSPLEITNATPENRGTVAANIHEIRTIVAQISSQLKPESNPKKMLEVVEQQLAAETSLENARDLVWEWGAKSVDGWGGYFPGMAFDLVESATGRRFPDEYFYFRDLMHAISSYMFLLTVPIGDVSENILYLKIGMGRELEMAFVANPLLSTNQAARAVIKSLKRDLPLIDQTLATVPLPKAESWSPQRPKRGRRVESAEEKRFRGNEILTAALHQALLLKKPVDLKKEDASALAAALPDINKDRAGLVESLEELKAYVRGEEIWAGLSARTKSKIEALKDSDNETWQALFPLMYRPGKDVSVYLGEQETKIEITALVQGAARGTYTWNAKKNQWVQRPNNRQSRAAPSSFFHHLWTLFFPPTLTEIYIAWLLVTVEIPMIAILLHWQGIVVGVTVAVFLVLFHVIASRYSHDPALRESNVWISLVQHSVLFLVPFLGFLIFPKDLDNEVIILLVGMTLQVTLDTFVLMRSHQRLRLGYALARYKTAANDYELSSDSDSIERLGETAEARKAFIKVFLNYRSHGFRIPSSDFKEYVATNWRMGELTKKRGHALEWDTTSGAGIPEENNAEYLLPLMADAPEESVLPSVAALAAAALLFFAGSASAQPQMKAPPKTENRSESHQSKMHIKEYDYDIELIKRSFDKNDFGNGTFEEPILDRNPDGRPEFDLRRRDPKHIDGVGAGLGPQETKFEKKAVSEPAKENVPKQVDAPKRNNYVWLILIAGGVILGLVVSGLYYLLDRLVRRGSGKIFPIAFVTMLLLGGSVFAGTGPLLAEGSSDNAFIVALAFVSLAAGLLTGHGLMKFGGSKIGFGGGSAPEKPDPKELAKHIREEKDTLIEAKVWNKDVHTVILNIHVRQGKPSYDLANMIGVQAEQMDQEEEKSFAVGLGLAQALDFGYRFDSIESALLSGFETETDLVSLVFVNNEADLEKVRQAKRAALGRNKVGAIGVIISKEAEDMKRAGELEIAVNQMDFDVPFAVVQESDLLSDTGPLTFANVFEQFSFHFASQGRREAERLFRELSKDDTNGKQVAIIGFSAERYRASVKLLDVMSVVGPILINIKTVLEAAKMA